MQAECLNANERLQPNNRLVLCFMIRRSLTIHHFYPPIGTVVSVLKLELERKSPIRAGLSYTQEGNDGIGWLEFFLFCFSRSAFRTSSRGCQRKKRHEHSVSEMPTKLVRKKPFATQRDETNWSLSQQDEIF